MGDNKLTRTEEILEPFQEDFSLFIEAGFLAVDQQDENNARKIFDAALALKPGHSAAKIGLGYIELNKLQVRKAEKEFLEVLKVDPENWLAQSFLGIAYLLTKQKRSEGEALLKRAMKHTDDPTIVNLGKVSLDWADSDLKKKPAPFFAQGSGEEKK